MAVHFGVSGVRHLITGVLLGAIEFPAPLDCRLNRLFLQIAAPNSEGDTLFNVLVNGVSIYGSPVDRPKILAGDTVSESFPTVDLTEGDIVSVDVVGAPLGGISGLYIIVQLQDAPTVQQYIKSMYQGAFGRQPDSGELAAAVSDLTAGCSGGTTQTAARALQEDIFTDTEYTSLGTTDDEYLEDVYNAVLGRLSDPGGFAFWQTQMVLGTTRSEILDFFNGSIEHQNLRLQPWCPQMPLNASANKLQGIDVALTAPTIVGQALVWDGSAWGPATLDFLSSTFDIKDPEARAATTAALPAYTGSAGVLTATSNGALTAQDGVTLVANDALLVRNETGGNEKWNGLYTVTQIGDGSHPFILTRRSDANTSAEVTPGMMVRVGNEGTANKNTMWWLAITGPVTLNTTALTFTQFGAAGGPPSGSAGGTLGGTYPNPTVNTDGATLETSANALRVKDSGVSYAKIQNVSATSRALGRKTSGAGVIEELTLSELLDFIGSAAQGDILYRGASAWARLAAGTSGKFLKTQGGGADPVWDTPSGGGATFSGVRVQVTSTSSGVLQLSASPVYDTDNYRQAASQLTFPATGYYHVSASYNYYTNSGNLEFYAWDGVSGRFATWGSVLTNNNIQTALLSFDRHFAAGDVIQFNTSSASAGGVLGNETGYACYISIHKIG